MKRKRDKLKDDIKEKFGTVSRFADLSGMDRYMLQKAFMPFYREKPEYVEFREQAAQKCAEIDPEAEGAFISEEIITALRAAIKGAGGLKEVVGHFEGQEGFSRANLYSILLGQRGKYKVCMTPTIQKLIDHFGITV